MSLGPETDHLSFNLKDYEFVTENDKPVVIGRGAFSTVYLLCLKSNRSSLFALKNVCLSQLSDDDKRRCCHEIVMLVRTDHPNIIKPIGANFSDNSVDLLLPFYKGGSLGHFLRKNGPIKNDQLIISLFHQLLLALQYLHAVGIIHRDIKTENILLERIPKTSDISIPMVLCDFGLASSNLDASRGNFSIVGTALFAAPEVCLGRKYSFPVDLWSAGVVLYQMMTSSYPFIGQNSAEIMRKVMTGQYTQPLHSNHFLIGLVKSLLVLDPLKRSTVSEILSLPEFSNIGFTSKKIPLPIVYSISFILFYYSCNGSIEFINDCLSKLFPEVSDLSVVDDSQIIRDLRPILSSLVTVKNNNMYDLSDPSLVQILVSNFKILLTEIPDSNRPLFVLVFVEFLSRLSSFSTCPVVIPLIEELNSCFF
ncbi:hypothetical protein RCL1_003343 [Eukaryota sp. TZLM3-RCL]